MTQTTYHAPHGGHPPQTDLLTDRAMFTEAYAVIPRGTMRDIVTSRLPFWEDTRVWVLARPLSGFAETFSQYIMEVQPGGGSDRPEPDPGAEAVLFVVSGELALTIGDEAHQLGPGGYAFLPPGREWRLRNDGDVTWPAGAGSPGRCTRSSRTAASVRSRGSSSAGRAPTPPARRA